MPEPPHNILMFLQVKKAVISLMVLTAYYCTPPAPHANQDSSLQELTEELQSCSGAGGSQLELKPELRKAEGASFKVPNLQLF